MISLSIKKYSALTGLKLIFTELGWVAPIPMLFRPVGALAAQSTHHPLQREFHCPERAKY
tara:strand:- start:42805 stop:42984 length:180 start_codon:yes stop_codon:yes gene_type:complete